MKKLYLILAALFLSVSFARADVPTPTLGTNLSGTITTTNTFQLIQTLTNNRVDCTVENNSATNTMWVYFGQTANATKGMSVQLAPGQSVGCRVAGGLYVLRNHVNITGTSGDAFFANFQ